MNRLSTGLVDLDELLGGGVEERAITEFFSPSPRILTLLHHRLILSLVGEGERVVSIHAQEFAGLDPYLLRAMARRIGVDWELVEGRFRLARGFKREDVEALIGEARSTGATVVMVFDPFLHGVTPGMSWGMRDLTREMTVISLNRGGRHPAGGRYHSHTVHALVGMRPLGEAVRAELMKHPSLPPSTAYLTVRELMGRWGGQRPLLEWL